MAQLFFIQVKFGIMASWKVSEIEMCCSPHHSEQKFYRFQKNPMYRFCDINAESGNYSGERSCSPLLPLAVHLRRNAKNLANFSSHFFTSKDFILKTTFPLVSKIVTSAVFPLWSSIVYILHFATFFMLIHLNKKINHGNKCLILPIGFSIASIIFTT